MFTHHRNRKIIHIDMDCFYAAIEIRDNPSLANHPVAVGGKPEERSVLCTCNYIARKFGVRSAMSSAYALRLCPDLIILPVNMQKYKEASQMVHTIFREYTSLIEPLALDEAYLDVTDSSYCQGSATLIAQEIRQKIADKTHLTASAGVAPNKFLAKVASGWNKPNGQFVIPPQNITDFVKDLSISELFGVGKVTAEKIHQMGLKTCEDLQKISLSELINHFGKLGKSLHDQCRGIDYRPVNPNRQRKSLSVERTFMQDIALSSDFAVILQGLYQMLLSRIQKNAPDIPIKNQYIKVKMSDFKLHTLEKSCAQIDFFIFQNLFQEFSQREKGAIRLLGLGVHFCEEEVKNYEQQGFILDFGSFN